MLKAVLHFLSLSAGALANKHRRGHLGEDRVGGVLDTAHEGPCLEHDALPRRDQRVELVLVAMFLSVNIVLRADASDEVAAGFAESDCVVKAACWDVSIEEYSTCHHQIVLAEPSLGQRIDAFAEPDHLRVAVPATLACSLHEVGRSVGAVDLREAFSRKQFAHEARSLADVEDFGVASCVQEPEAFCIGVTCINVGRFGL